MKNYLLVDAVSNNCAADTHRLFSIQPALEIIILVKNIGGSLNKHTCGEHGYEEGKIYTAGF